ncbi:MAG: FAD-dependent oxidoreductase, partial [Actinomycetota bacterium]
DVDVTTELVQYTDDDEVAYVDDGIVTVPIKPIIFDVDSKFVGSSWLDFYETYVLPGIADTIEYDTPIVEIDHSLDDRVVLTDSNGGVHEADSVIVTVPLRILQLGDVTFTPPLDDARQEAIDGAEVWSGFKAFFEFEETFYPAALAYADSDTDDGQRLFYDAAYGQRTGEHILGLFTVGAPAERYGAMSDEEFLADVLDELDATFDGAASRSYVKHLVQNWNDEPFARGGYLADDESASVTNVLAEPLGNRVYFAGDAYTSFDDWSSVHAAARSASDAVDQLLG